MKEGNKEILDYLYGKVTPAQYRRIAGYIRSMGYQMRMLMYTGDDGTVVSLSHHRDVGWGDNPVDMRDYTYEFRHDGKMRLTKTTAPFPVEKSRKWH